jgi:hypothetical protein
MFDIDFLQAIQDIDTHTLVSLLVGAIVFWLVAVAAGLVLLVALYYGSKR